VSLQSDVQAEAAAAPEPTPEAPAGNPALLGLPTFLVAGITLGLWLIGYLDTATLGGGMIAAAVFSAGAFLLVSSIWAQRVGNSVVAGIFGTFSAFWLSFGFLLMGLLNGWFGLSTDPDIVGGQIQSVQAAYVLSWLIVFVMLTVSTLRLPLGFTVGFVFVCATFALVLAFVISGNSLFATLAGICTFIFCAIYAYIFVDAMTQELGGKAMPMGNPIIG